MNAELSWGRTVSDVPSAVNWSVSQLKYWSHFRNQGYDPWSDDWERESVVQSAELEPQKFFKFPLVLMHIKTHMYSSPPKSSKDDLQNKAMSREGGREVDKVYKRQTFQAFLGTWAWAYAPRWWWPMYMAVDGHHRSPPQLPALYRDYIKSPLAVRW